jgi:hypothetical protein
MRLKFRDIGTLKFTDFGKKQEMMLSALYTNLAAKRRFGFCDNSIKIKDPR